MNRKQSLCLRTVAKLPIKGTFKATTESKHRITVSEFHVVKEITDPY